MVKSRVEVFDANVEWLSIIAYVYRWLAISSTANNWRKVPASVIREIVEIQYPNDKNHQKI